MVNTTSVFAIEPDARKQFIITIADPMLWGVGVGEISFCAGPNNFSVRAQVKL